MPRSSRSTRDRPSIEDELRWVEDSIPEAPGAALLPTDDVGFAARLRDDEADPSLKPGGQPEPPSAPAPRGPAGKSAVWASLKIVALGFVIGVAIALVSHAGGGPEHSRDGVKTMMHAKSSSSPEADAVAVDPKVEAMAIAKQAAHEDVAARRSADKVCLKIEGVQSVTFYNLATDKPSTDRDVAANAFCQCKKGLKASGPGSKNDVNYGTWPIERGWSIFPASCVDAACRCF